MRRRPFTAQAEVESRCGSLLSVLTSSRSYIDRQVGHDRPRQKRIETRAVKDSPDIHVRGVQHLHAKRRRRAKERGLVPSANVKERKCWNRDSTIDARRGRAKMDDAY